METLDAVPVLIEYLPIAIRNVNCKSDLGSHFNAKTGLSTSAFILI